MLRTGASLELADTWRDTPATRGRDAPPTPETDTNARPTATQGLGVLQPRVDPVAMAAEQPDGIDSVVEDARRRRKLLRHCMEELETAIAAPAPGRETAWAQEVASSLGTLTSAFERHVAETESPDGFLQQLTTEAPRLDPAVSRLRRDHARIKLLIQTLRTGAREAAAGGHPSPTDLRTAALELLGQLARHRQRGADLIYEAYLVDIGTGD